MRRFTAALFLLAACAAPLRADGPAARPAYDFAPLPTPTEAILEVGGMDWMPDGRLMVCTRRGEVWSRKGDGPTAEWKLFATGLQEALGLLHGDKGEVYVMQRPEMTKLIDTDHDGVADRYETVSANFGFSGNYHEFAYGPVRDKDGNLCGALNLSHHPDAWKGNFMGVEPNTAYRGWFFKITPYGEFVPWASGLRSPNGVCLSPDGELFFTDNQGEFIGACWLAHVKKGAFYGHPSSLAMNKEFNPDPSTETIEDLDAHREPPAVIFPYGRMGQSLSQPAWDTTAGKFGPFAGQIFVGDVTVPILMRASLQLVGGDYQGACYPFMQREELRGANRLLFAPDGSLYVGVTDRGWGKGTSGIYRIAFASLPFEIKEMALTKTGFDLTFTKPVDRARAKSPEAYQMQHWHLVYHREYGSPEADKTPVVPSEIRISDDGTRVSLTIPDLQAKKVYQLTLPDLKAADGSPLRNNAAYYTVNKLVP